MKKSLFLLVITLCTIIMTGCYKTTPTKASSEYLTYCKKGNYKKIPNCLYFEGTKEEQKKEKEYATEIMVKLVGPAYDAKKGLKDFSILSETIHKGDTTATVHYAVVYGNGDMEENDLYLFKKGNKWYLYF